MPGSSASTGNLPATVERVLGDFLEAVKASFGQDLRSAVLYGSAAEGRLRATSDVNLVLVLERFEPAAADRLREPLRVAQAAARLSPMFLLASEVQDAAEAFAGKFSDILRRRRVLFGPDPFSSLAIPRAAALVRLRQVLLNQTLRLRAFYVERSLREEQLALVVADAAAPLRSSAALLLELLGRPAPSPREALEAVAAEEDADLREALPRLSEARTARRLPPGTAGPTLFRLLRLAERMRARAIALR